MATFNSPATYNPPLIAQEISCVYPISDTYGPTPRYLYYVCLFLSFWAPRYGWLAHAVLGAAVAYAATAAVQTFILLSARLVPAPVQNVTIPYISSTNLTGYFAGIKALVTNRSYVEVQPDYLELDIDAVTSVVITAYLVGLPLQCWSRITRASTVLHRLVLVWNLVMLAASISVLILWPHLNVAPAQYRFCYANVDDGDSFQNSNGWDKHYWDQTWNQTVWKLFGQPLLDNRLWFNYTSNCMYPCFSTSQILRQATSLKASALTPNAPGAKLHTDAGYGSDDFQPLIYTAITSFTAAQLFLLAMGRLKFCTERVPIYEPRQLWTRRKEIWQSFNGDFKRGWVHLMNFLRSPQTSLSLKTPRQWNSNHTSIRQHPLFLFSLDLLVILVLFAAMLFGPLTVIAFIIWIEHYIHQDGAPTESPRAVGQWGITVQLGVVLFAACVLRLKYRVASEEEVRREIEHRTEELDKLKIIADQKRLRLLSQVEEQNK
ncbi:uncharacterized protein PV06_02844 [Exophiala oligosperma]|uniref:Uncharacterized protein n=2 Tax=Chaetothyriales TaxID=34395 RepID=A0A0D2DX88_9EURO|nr:uncharacterized protein PV06_02844 [Exophiala oligosperma]KAJ9635615.1 hypothetical protein H2204_005789 [Knufia peltigerae]KIW47260.1 hypothetical protein PV06_02844 [Exophiala oligosperma]